VFKEEIALVIPKKNVRFLIDSRSTGSLHDAERGPILIWMDYRLLVIRSSSKRLYCLYK
jgi:hypothetical protein